MANNANNYKPKHKLPEMEEVSVNTIYSFTYNPKDSNDKKTLTCYIASIINMLKDESILLYKLHTEFSHLGRIHFHGYIKIIDPLMFYYKIVPKMANKGTIYIDTIGDHDKWRKYVTKQDKLFQDVFMFKTIFGHLIIPDT